MTIEPEETEKKKYDPTQYMRDYRASGRDNATKVQNLAKMRAIKWVRSNHPDVWRLMLDQARIDLAKKD